MEVMVTREEVVGQLWEWSESCTQTLESPRMMAGYCEPSNEVICGYKEVTRNSVGDRVEDRDIKGADETFFHEGREVMVWK